MRKKGAGEDALSNAREVGNVGGTLGGEGDGMRVMRRVPGEYPDQHIGGLVWSKTDVRRGCGTEEMRDSVRVGSTGTG